MPAGCAAFVVAPGAGMRAFVQRRFDGRAARQGATEARASRRSSDSPSARRRPFRRRIRAHARRHHHRRCGRTRGGDGRNRKRPNRPESGAAKGARRARGGDGRNRKRPNRPESGALLRGRARGGSVAAKESSSGFIMHGRRTERRSLRGAPPAGIAPRHGSASWRNRRAGGDDRRGARHQITSVRRNGSAGAWRPAHGGHVRRASSTTVLRRRAVPCSGGGMSAIRAARSSDRRVMVMPGGLRRRRARARRRRASAGASKRRDAAAGTRRAWSAIGHHIRRRRRGAARTSRGSEMRRRRSPAAASFARARRSDAPMRRHARVGSPGRAMKRPGEPTDGPTGACVWLAFARLAPVARRVRRAGRVRGGGGGHETVGRRAAGGARERDSTS